jgi:hypothetical protein
MSLLVALIVSTALPAQTVTIGTSAAQCGQSVSVPVSIDNVSGLLSLEFRVSYDRTMLTMSNVTAGSVTSGFALSSNVAGGQLHVAMASGTPAGGAGTVANILFNVNASAGGALPLTISNVLVNDVAHTGAGGAVNVTCLHAPAAPSNVAPADGATSVASPVTLQWSSVVDATSYRIHFGTSSAPPFVQVSSATQSQVQTSPGTTYYWSIEAVNAAGATPGPTWSFSTAGTFCATPDAPQGVSAPPSIASGAPFDVAWSSVTNATAYVVEESADPLFAGATSTIVNVAHASFTKSVTSERTFYYRVYARNGNAPCNVDGPYSISSAVHVTPRPPLAANARVLPVAGSVDGSGGSFFRTSVQLHNPSDATLRGTIRFHPQGATGSDSDPSMTYAIAPGETLSWSDLLPAMNISRSIGSVDLVPDLNSAPPLSVVRVYNDAGANGTSGLTLDALALADALQAGQRGVIVAPIDSSRARLNIGIRTLLDGVTMTITVRGKHGATLATLHQSYPPTYFTQVPAATLTNVAFSGDETIVFDVEAGSAMIYASSTDNTTQDPSVQIARPIAR